MARRVAAELIYDAILDDDLFAQLPAALAAAYGARSCNILWQPVSESFQVSAKCGHFSDEHLQLYVDHFANKDHWALRALTSERVNRAQNCAEYVSTAEYEGSEFYNDWIRHIGDDTYRCMGMMVASGWGTGIIGFHKGRTQADFEDMAVRQFSEDGAHLRRMLAVRGRISAAEMVGRRAKEALDCLGFPVLTVDVGLRVLTTNRAADALFSARDLALGRSGVLRLGSRSETRRLEVLVARAADRQTPAAGAMAITTADGRIHQLTVVAMQMDSLAQRSVVILITPSQTDASIEARLAALFGLTRAEAEIAAALASGCSPRLVAEQRCVSVQTIRSQLKAIYAKMGCHSRAEMASLVGRLPSLSR